MTRDHRQSKEDFPRAEAKRLRAEKQSYKAIGNAIGWSEAQTRRELLASVDDTALQSADDTAVMVTVTSPTIGTDIPDIPPETVQGYALSSADTLSDHETRLQVLESFVKALQEHAQQPPVQHITVQSGAYALHSAESVQSWEDPDDAKPERWNLWLPRGIKRRIEAQAKAAGIAPSQLVQRLLMAALNGQEVRHDA